MVVSESQQEASMQVRHFQCGSWLMRFVVRDNRMFEEKFAHDDREWVPTADLSRPFYLGDAGLIELTVAQSRQMEPLAF